MPGPKVPFPRRPAPVLHPSKTQQVGKTMQTGKTQPSAEGASVKKSESKEPITLAQFLKVVQVADSGGMAKALVREGRATVNGESEERPGRKLAKDDVVEIDGKTFTVDR
jgi:ribosome-associated protein